jgi:hypothetical protein
MSVTLVGVLFVAVGLTALGAFIAAWKRELTAALGGLPLIGQEMAVLLAIAALAAVGLGVGLAGRESPR